MEEFFKELQQQLKWSDAVFKNYGAFPTADEVGVSDENPISDTFAGARWVLTTDNELVLGNCMIPALTKEKHDLLQSMDKGVLQ